MPAVINILANLLFGSCMALVARRSPALRRDFVSWPLLFLLAFEALLFTPIATFLFRFYPHWSLSYWFDPQVHPGLDKWIGWLSLAAVLLNFVAAVLGYAVTRAGLLRERRAIWATPAALGTGALVAIAYVHGDRIVLIGEGDAFWHGQARILLSAAAGWVGISAYVGMAAFLLWIHRRFAERDPSIV